MDNPCKSWRNGVIKNYGDLICGMNVYCQSPKDISIRQPKMVKRNKQATRKYNYSTVFMVWNDYHYTQCT